MSKHRYFKAGFLALMLSATAGNAAAQTAGPSARLNLAPSQTPTAPVNALTSGGQARTPEGDGAGLESGKALAFPLPVELPESPDSREIRYIEHASPMEVQRAYARMGAKGYVHAFATINRRSGRCTIHLPGYESSGRYEKIRRHWLEHCSRGEFHGPGEGTEPNPDFKVLLKAYADWIGRRGAIPGRRRAERVEYHAAITR